AAIAGADSTIHARARQAGAATLDSGPRRAIVLSRAESVAIADAVRKRMEAEQRQKSRAGGGTGAGAAAGAAASAAAGVDEAVRAAATFRAAQPSIDSMRAEFQRVLGDSIRTALEALRRAPVAVPPNVKVPRTYVWSYPADTRDSSHLVVAPILPPPRGERRRVAVMSLQNGTGRADLDGMVRGMSDSLRAEFIGRRRANTEAMREYEMVDGPTTRAAEQRALNPVAVGFTLRSDYVVHGVAYLRRDSVRVTTQVLDVRAGRVLVSYTGGSVPLTAPYGKVPVLAERMDERIEQAIERAAREEERRHEAQQRATERAQAAKEKAKEKSVPPR
ncbi:MAG: hypothetical protein ACJ8AO_03385, partial [Gemmatimonadaceae bacterium]